MTEIEILAQKLDIGPAQLAKLRVKHKTDEKLVIWLRVTEAHLRDRRRLLSRRSVPPYTETPSQALTDAGEAPPPEEIGDYRHSRQAQARYVSERQEQVADLFGACRDIRSAVDGLDEELKKSISRDLWVLKGKLDRLEQKLRRRLAA